MVSYTVSTVYVTPAAVAPDPLMMTFTPPAELSGMPDGRNCKAIVVIPPAKQNSFAVPLSNKAELIPATVPAR